MSRLEDIRAYWNLRAEGYSAQNRDELKDEGHRRWADMILRYAPEGSCLKVLDIGCGPGFFSILMARCGHQVTGIDYSDEMIRQAGENAAAMGQTIHFLCMDAQNLEFSDESFDLIVTRNVSWCLEQPKRAYQEWLRVLRKGGRIVNFDGNYYLDRFDPAYAQAVNAIRESSDLEHKQYTTGVDTEIINRIALNLPLSQEKRPEWDFGVLSALGVAKIDVELLRPVKVQKEGENRYYADSFLISAQK